MPTHLTANWKTTVVGLLILLMSLCNSVKFDPAGHLAMTAKDWFSILPGLCAAVVGAIQKDAGTTMVLTRTGEVKPEDSHEIPDDPANQPLSKG